MSTIPNELPTVAPLPDPDGVDPVRVARGQRIAASTTIIEQDGGWIIPSDSRPNVYYRIWLDENGYHCNCPDPLRTCKHILALRFQRNGNPEARAVPTLASTPVSSTAENPPPVSQDNGSTPIPADPPASPGQLTYWQAYNRSQTNEGWLFPHLLYSLCALVPEPVSQGRGRPQASIRDLIFGEVLREYDGKSSRRFQTAIHEAAEKEYISKRYGYNTGTNFLNSSAATELLRALITESARPLQGIERVFAIDSSGFSTKTYGRWFDEKYGAERTRATYVKSHILVGVESHIITAAAASVEPVGDVTMLQPLLEETRLAEFSVEKILADGAYRSEAMVEWMHTLGIESLIPFHNNAVFHHDSSLWDRQLGFFLYHQDLFAEQFHQRSQVESAYSMTKEKYGQRVRGKMPTSQANNVLCKLLANNVYVLIRSIYELGLEPEFAQIRTRQSAAA